MDIETEPDLNRSPESREVAEDFSLVLGGRREYGALAQRYVREFDAKWLRGGVPTDEPFIGSSDIQSLADLGNSYAVIKEMRLVPFDTKTMLHLAVSTVAPMLPLVLTMVPLNEL